VIVPTVIVLVGVGVFFLLTNRSDGGQGPLVTPPTTVPAFNFKVTKTEVFPTNATDPKKLQGATSSVAKTVSAALSDMYQWAYLDPSNRSDGSYDEVWNYFTEPIAAKARADESTLTLGANAGDEFSDVQPGRGAMQVEVLTDKKNKPSTAVAIVKFTAHATGTDNAATTIVSGGQYFLQPAAGGWRVTGYKVLRKDHEKTSPNAGATPSAGATTSASAGATP
jgi:hypothetical protein